MDLEQFRTGWWSSPTSTVSLDMEEWIDGSYGEQESFWKSLMALQNTFSTKPTKAAWGDYYDFYHDLVIRHPESNTALTVIEESGFVQTWTFKKLHRLINFQLKGWLKQGVKTGQLVALVLPPGIHFVIALLTALRLGLKISFLPVESRFLGKHHLYRILDQIAPSAIISLPELSLPLKKGVQTVFVDNLGEDDFNHEPTSFPYPADETMQLSVALYRQQPFSIVPLDAHTTYLHALRDGILAFNLKPGATHSTLHSCLIRSEPCSTLMTLLCGASLVHIEEENLTEDPVMLKNEKVHLLEIAPAYQKLWSKTPGVPKQLKGVYKTPWHHHHQSWQSFVQMNKLEEVQAFHLLIDNSMGGALFFSKPTTKDLDYFMKPLPGTLWSLKDVNGSGADTLKGFGLLYCHTSCKENNQVASNLILSHINKNCLVSGTILPCRDGVTIPIEALEAAAASLPFVESCLLYAFPEMGHAVQHQLILLVFVNPMKTDITDEIKKEWTEQLTFQFIDEGGAAFVPDKIEYYPLVPKMIDGMPDRNWCIEQFNRGFLAKKQHIQLYQALSILKKIVQ